MGLFDLNFFRTGFMKKARFMVSSNKRAQPVVVISETGVIAHEEMALEPGYCSADQVKMSWLILHQLKLLARNKFGQIDDDPILLITERSYMPLDPLKTLTAAQKAKITPLTDVARIRHAEVRAGVGEEGATTARDKMLLTIANTGMIIIGILAVCVFIIRMIR